MTERRPIPGYEGHYEVSENGEVFSVDRVITMKNGRRKTCKARRIKLMPHRGKYLRFVAKRDGGYRNMYAHHAVLLAYHGPKPEGKEGAHLNGDPSDNRACNLAWVTPKENQSHRILHGTDTRGDTHPSSRLTERQVKWMRRNADRFTQREFAKRYGVAFQTINLAINGKTWKHI